MSALSKFGKYRPGVVPVTVPDWGDEVIYVKGMDASAMEAFFAIHGAEKDEAYSAERSARVIVLHLCDEHGNRLVSEDDRDEAVRELCGHKFSVISHLLAECMNASGLSQGEIEETAKN
jgi:hypothetical protein